MVRIVTVVLLIRVLFARVKQIIMALHHIVVQSAQLTPSVQWTGHALIKNVSIHVQAVVVIMRDVALLTIHPFAHVILVILEIHLNTVV